MNKLRDELYKDFEDKEYAETYLDEYLNAEIATQIKVIREQRGLTQQQLAGLCGMAQARVSLLEDVNYGSWSINTLKKLANAFDVALKVSFESVGKRIEDIVNFNREALERPSRMEALQAYEEQEAIPHIVIDMYKWQKKRNRSEESPFAIANRGGSILDQQYNQGGKPQGQSEYAKVSLG